MDDKRMKSLQEHVERDLPMYVTHFKRLNKKINFLIGLTYFAMILPLFLRAFDLI